MGRIARKRRLRTIIFYVFAAFVLIVLVMYSSSIGLALIRALNKVVETINSLAGR